MTRRCYSVMGIVSPKQLRRMSEGLINRQGMEKLLQPKWKGMEMEIEMKPKLKWFQLSVVVLVESVSLLLVHSEVSATNNFLHMTCCAVLAMIILLVSYIRS